MMVAMDGTAGLDELTRELQAILRGEGLHATLQFLNARTRFRFTGLYRIDAPTLHNLCLFDRENPEIVLSGAVPLRETYCSIVGDQGVDFATDDAGADPRLADHPARGSVIAYCGTPVVVGGRCIGSLCHFDSRPRLVPVEELPLLTRAAAVIAATMSE